MGKTVAGIDACRLGKQKSWVAIVLRGGRFSKAHTGEKLDDLLLHKLNECDAIGIDIPIGLLDTDPRPCDEAARRWLKGPRRNTLFMTPGSRYLDMECREDASAASKKRQGAGISTQAWALRERIMQVETLSDDLSARLFEAHPEVSFHALATTHGADPAGLASKKSWTGATHRRELLLEAGIDIPSLPEEDVARVATDDVLDAAVVAWTADRYVRDKAAPLPEGQARGARPTIWY